MTADDTPRTFIRYRRRFPNSNYGATPAHENLTVLNRTWMAGVLEQQTVTYGAWEELKEEAGTG